MNTVTHTHKPKTERNLTSQMEVGEAAIIKKCSTYPEYVGKIIVKSYNDYVLLEDFGTSWDGEPDFPVEILPKGTKIYLTLEKGV